MRQILTYLEAPSTLSALKPDERSRLLFRADLLKGPGMDERLAWHIGRSHDGRFVVLWGESSLDGSGGWQAVAAARGEPMDLTAELGSSLLRSYWEAERDVNDWEEPNYSDLPTARGALLRPSAVRAVAAQVWPDCVAS